MIEISSRYPLNHIKTLQVNSSTTTNISSQELNQLINNIQNYSDHHHSTSSNSTTTTSINNDHHLFHQLNNSTANINSNTYNTNQSNNEIIQMNNITSSNGHIYGLCLSNNKDMLCTVNTSGSIHIWTILNKEYKLIFEYNYKNIFDLNYEFKNQRIIEEYYVCKFSPSDEILCVGGKRKNRYEWDTLDEDNKILECPLTLINLLNNQINFLYGHTEEILCLESLFFKNQFYFVTGSFDGTIIKWLMNRNDNYMSCLDKQVIMDRNTNVVLDLNFLFFNNFNFINLKNNSNLNNNNINSNINSNNIKIDEEMNEELIYMIASCDNSIKIYNFGNNQLLKIFNTEYETYLSSLQIILKNNDITNNILNCYLITKGVNSNEEIASNSDIHLRKLNLNLKNIQNSTLETLHTFQHDDYYCNSWMAKCKYFNGYLFAPSCYGKLFIWNLHTKQLCAILNDHSENAYIRNTLATNQSNNGFYLFTCGDDSITNIYESSNFKSTCSISLDQIYKSNNSNSNSNGNSSGGGNSSPTTTTSSKTKKKK